MPSLNGITVRVYSDGNPLEEYSPLVDAGPPSVASCWIASTQDTAFEIHYQFEENKPWGFSCNLSCDGICMRATSVRQERTSLVHNMARSGENMCPMFFSRIFETDDQEAEDSANPSIGIIKVTIFRVESDWESQPSKVTSKEVVVIDDSPLHESKKMLGGHRVRLGSPSIHKPYRKVKSIDIDHHTSPYVTFEFHYRPISILQALGHALPLPSKRASKRGRSSSPEPEDVLDSNDEAQKIAVQIQELQERQERILRERREKRSTREIKRFKREDLDIAVPTSAKEEIIDLCSD